MGDLEQSKRELKAFVIEVYDSGYISRLDRDARIARIRGALAAESLSAELADLKRVLAGGESSPPSDVALYEGSAPVEEVQLVQVRNGSLDRRSGPWLVSDRLRLELHHASAHISFLEMGEGGRFKNLDVELEALNSSIHLVVNEGTRIIDELTKEGSNLGMNGRLKRSMVDSFYTMRLWGSIRGTSLYIQAK